MKFSLKTITTMCACAALAFAILANAQSTNDSATVETTIDVEVNTGNVTAPPRNVPPKQLPPIKRVLHATENRINDNKDVRNQVLRQESGVFRKENIDIKAQFRSSGTGTPQHKAPRENFQDRMNGQKEKMKNMRKEAALQIQTNHGKILGNAIQILMNAEARLREHADKREQAGKDVTTALELLDDAHEAIATAKIDVDAFIAWKPTELAAQASADAEIEVSRPRELFETAKKSIFKAREILREAAKALGIGEKKEVRATTTIEVNINNNN